MGFAIPTQIVNPVVQSLVRDGKVAHGRMGIGITDVTPENAKFFDVHDSDGAVVTQIEPNSAGRASRAEGWRRDHRAERQEGHGCRRASDGSRRDIAGNEDRVAGDARWQVISVPVTLEGMDGSDHDTKVADNTNDKPHWGLGIGDITPEVREQLQAPDDLHGAVIERVLPGSPSDDAGLQPGQVIMGVNRHETNSASDVQKALTSIPKGQDALVLIWANGGSTFRVLHASSGA